MLLAWQDITSSTLTRIFLPSRQQQQHSLEESVEDKQDGDLPKNHRVEKNMRRTKPGSGDEGLSFRPDRIFAKEGG